MTKQHIANIMPGLACGSQQCEFVSMEGTPEQKLQHLALHAQTAHPVQQPHQVSGAPRGKVDRPTLRPVSDLESWEFFRYQWANYKTAMGITGGTTSAHLYGCLDEELQRDLQKSNQGVVASDMTEADLLEAVKKLAVKQESKLAHRIKMGKAVQSPGTSIRIFYAQLKGLATACDYTITSRCQCARDNIIDYADHVIQDQLIRGIADHEILADLLGDEKTNRTTPEIVDYIARKEQAKVERGTVCGETPPNTAAVTAGAAPKRGSSPCRGCGGPNHGSRAKRLSECPAKDVTCDRCSVKGHFTKNCIKCRDCQQWGHNSKNSKYCQQGKKSETGSINVHKGDNGFVISNLSHITRQADLRLATVGSKKGRTVPLTHHIFSEGSGWTAQPSAPHPTLQMVTTACPEDHSQFGHPVSNISSMTSCTQACVCDTGCMSTAIPPSAAYKVGFKKKDFIPVASRMNGAGRDDLGVIGAVVMQFSIATDTGKRVNTKQLCYVCTRVNKIYISRQGLRQLNIIGEDFPLPNNTEVSSISNKETGCDCGCPIRESSPPPPPAYPSHLAGDVAKLKEYLLCHYASSVFNTCECQNLPKLPGPPLRLNVDPAAKPVACHRVQPVPLHWQEKVQEDLLRDVKLGVLEKLPTNTPTTWLSRMVITAKSNGEPRRTIDYQPLNKHVKRQTFPMETPFQLATRIPPMSKKTVVDNWNGFHSVSLHPDDRHYTAFLAPSGRYRYAVAAQGNMVSGDAFNERMDEIFSEFSDKVRCVDDAAMWTVGDDVATHFKKVVAYLDTCAKNNIVLNPNKFQFCQDTVDFAGFKISPTSLMPSDKMLESIRNFPTPTDISGVRAYFGLVNQVAYAFAMTEEMYPMRHLLSPKTPFEWTPELDALFAKSKEIIVDKVIEGVKLFDPSLTTCLATDFSGKGVGFILLQKTCTCTSRTPTCCPEGWRVCLVGSRFLHDSENRYAPIEGECLAVVYGLQKCKYFLLGCTDLIIATDHKPLLSILNDRCLADIDNRRLRNLKEKTLPFQFNIVHVPGKKHVGPDAASRYPVSPGSRLQVPGEPPEAEVSTTKVRHSILDSLAIIETSEEDIDGPFITGVEGSMSAMRDLHNCCTTPTNGACAISTHNVISWDQIKGATAEDNEMQDLIKYIMSGFPEDARMLPAHVKPYKTYQSALYIVDGVVMLGDRVVVPRALRLSVLHLLHAAHQGVDRMKARSADSVFWHGIVGDIVRHREACRTCHQMAKSNPSLPPYDPPEPEYPFQYLAADYFHHGNKDYCVVVDRYSHWPIVFTSEQGARGFTDMLRRIFSTYGICQELATDGASVFTGGLTQTFLQDWGVKHRLSSVANPHSNCRAELAVKQIKRIIADNCGPSGTLDVDSYHRAILSYRNTPDPYTKVSPAMAIFGRQVRDGLPVSPGHYNPHNTWRELLDHREHAMARRHNAGREQWEAHTKDLVKLEKGDNVFLQNLVGNHPRRWERTGKVLECKEFDQYLIKVDGTGRTTLRNRKHLRKFQPIPSRYPTPTTAPSPPATWSSPPSLPTTVPEATSHQPEPSQPARIMPDQVSLFPRSEQYLPDARPDAVQDTYEPVPTMSQAQDPPTPNSLPMPHHLPAPEPQDDLPQPSPAPSTRPQRQRKPNVKLDPAEWELGQIDNAKQYIPIINWCLHMIGWIVQQEEVGGTRGGRR